MKSRRIARASEAVREVVSTTILFGLRDPRVKQVTVIGAEVAQDLRTAKVYVSVMGDAKQQSLTMHGLESARGYIQSKIAERLDTRYTPVLKFVLDPSVKTSIAMSQVIRETLAKEQGGTVAEETSAEFLDDDEEDDDELTDAEAAAESEDSDSVEPDEDE